ncbi:putative receptor-like protein kinase [Panicum miliaceum]|uniref:Receptor-like protein kinase n=1 Tax=Panicum miliaceum TaxID=4540 RepID=A0A3L6TEY7_PANMI|nr:putative receptor-like protein kinase [Panicum miliaceum]
MNTGNSNVEPSALDLSFRRSRKRSRRRGRSVGSDIHSGCSGDFLSRELSSTTSMRGMAAAAHPVVADEAGGGQPGGWCRQLARAGNVLELMDKRLDGGYDRDQATQCVQLALLCLQRQPELRPDSTDIVILDGEMELPPAPVEFSPSPRVRPFPRSSRRAAQPALIWLLAGSA